jgi:hypothetical protein
MRPYVHATGVLVIGVVIALMDNFSTQAQEFVPNYDESKIPPYTLPELLTCQDGTQVTDAKIWKEKRRPEILQMFRQEMFGVSPPRPKLNAVVFEQSAKALSGKAIRKQVRIRLSDKDDAPSMSLLMYLPPSGATKPVPVFLGLNFQGNYTVTAEPEIPITDLWVHNEKDLQTTDHKANPEARGKLHRRWPIEQVIQRGYGVATIYYGDIDPDYDDAFQNGVHSLYDSKNNGERAPNAWGSLAAWAWGLSLALDYLETDSQVNAKQVAVLGHSRLGKTALWAGAADERFALVISNNSGCGGAALNRRKFGETVERITRAFPHWFCDNFDKYQENEDSLPFDQHMLIALMAPRPVYTCSASEDLWADPRGEFLSGFHAAPIYELMGLKGLGTESMPAVNQPIGEHIGYHLREGKHDIISYDWDQFMNFADRHFKKK